METAQAQIGEVVQQAQACPAAQPHFATRFLPTLTDVAFILPMLFIFLRMGGAPILLGDGDTGWHIRAGDWILDNGRVPQQDIFSFTKAGEPWFAWEWLWDVSFASLHRHGGMAAVIIASTLVLSVTFALLFRLTRRKCSHPFIAITVLFFACGSSSIHWLARPHLFTLLLLTSFYAILERVHEGRRRPLLWLLPLTVLWTNLHGGFVFGIALILTYAAGQVLEWLSEPDPTLGREALREATSYLLTAGGCLAVSLINPYFYRLHLHIATYALEPYHFMNIAEFQSPTFHHPNAIYFETMLLAGVVAVGWCLYRRRFIHVLLLLSWAHLSLRSGRNIPIFIILATPIIACTIEELVLLLARLPVAERVHKAAVQIRDFGSEFAITERLGRYPVAGALAAIILVLLFYLPTGLSALRAEYNRKDFPAQSVEALRALRAPVRLFTVDTWGGYLIYRLYPGTKVFIDGRSDFYGPKFGESYIDVMNAKFNWERILARYQVNTVLLPVDAPLASTLKETKRWKVLYDDKVAIIFQATGTVDRAPLGEARISTVTGSGVNCDRKITLTNIRDLRVATYYARR